jgi:hypothetical protein
MRPAPVKLVAHHTYDTVRLKFVCFLDGEGYEYEAECLNWADWFDAGDIYSGPQAEGVEPVFEATSVFHGEGE